MIKKEVIEEIKKVYLVKENVEVVVDVARSRAFCGKAYAGHPKGCPNFGKFADCPPQAGFYPELYKTECRLVAVGLDLKGLAENRRKRFPNYTDKSLRNSRIWQGHLKAELRKLVAENIKDDETALYRPEATGVDVTETVRRVEIILEWPPKNWAFKIAFLVKKKED